MKIIFNKLSALEKTTRLTNKCEEIYRKKPFPMTAAVGRNIVRLFFSAMYELTLADENTIKNCSSVARYLDAKVDKDKRQEFLDIIERVVWEVEAYNNDKSRRLSMLSIKVIKANRLKDIADFIIEELYAKENVKEKLPEKIKNEEGMTR